jgi:hypothetical protein
MHSAAPWAVLVLNQAAWLVAIRAGAAGRWWPGVVAVAVVIAVHLVWVARHDAWRLLLSVPIGWSVDAMLGLSGACAWPEQSLPPPWLTALWPNFAVLLTGCLAWLPRRSLGWAAILGALGGTLAYVGGAGLGAVTFPHGALAGQAAVAVAWALACPLLVALARESSRREVRHA